MITISWTQNNFRRWEILASNQAQILYWNKVKKLNLKSFLLKHRNNLFYRKYPSSPFLQKISYFSLQKISFSFCWFFPYFNQSIQFSFSHLEKWWSLLFSRKWLQPEKMVENVRLNHYTFTCVIQTIPFSATDGIQVIPKILDIRMHPHSFFA